MSDEKLELSAPDRPRVRLAPSPTGPLHIGTARTALFNYLFARQSRGTFVLRIEDTDHERSKKKWEKDILKYLAWLGLDWDEGPDKGGPFAPYRQSERVDIYTPYIKQLLDQGQAYYCFCTKDELAAQKEYQASIGEPPRYIGRCRNIDPKEAQARLKRGESAVIRLKVSSDKVISFQDQICGQTDFNSSELGDFIIAKNLKEPLYNLAVVVDDYLMKITHVIRGADHISNTPKQILIAEALGLPQPQYAHLPLVLSPNRRKLSKREEVVAVSDYYQQGYLPQALVNFMILLGWNEGTDREIYSMDELVEKFSLDKVQRSGGIFDLKRLNWMNGYYIRQESLPVLTQMCIPYLIKSGHLEEIPNGSKKYRIKETKEIVSLGYLGKVIGLYQERLKVLSEIPELVDYFFKKEVKYQPTLLIWKDKDKKEIKNALNRAIKALSGLKRDWTLEKINEALLGAADEIGDRGTLLWPVRAALTGKENSASPFDVAYVLGPEKTIRRLERAAKLL